MGEDGKIMGRRLCFHSDGLLFVLMLMIIISSYQVECADCPSDIQQNTNPGLATAVVSWPDPTTNTTCDFDPGDAFGIGSTLVSCADSTDDSTCTFTVIITDNEVPTIQCPSPIQINTIPGQSTGQANWNIPQGSDNVGVDSASRHCSPTTGSHFTIGTTSVTCKVRDTSGNEARCQFQVTVRDNEDPVFTTCPSNPIRRIMSNFEPLLQTAPVVVTWHPPTASDNSGGSVTLNATHVSGERFELGVTRVTYTARDESGNVNSNCAFNVQIVVQPPADIIITDTNAQHCMTVVWPESGDESVEEYALYYWIQGESKPDPRQRIVVERRQGDLTYTYNRHQICGLSPGALYTIEVGKEAGDVMATTDHWTTPSQPGQVSIVPGTLSSSSAEVTWERVSLKNVEQHTVRISGRDAFVTKTTDRLMVDSLRPGRGVYLYVRSVVGSGDERLYSSYVGKNISPASPRDDELVAYEYTESTITVAWLARSSSKNTKDPYMLYISPEDAEENFLTIFSPGSTSTATAVFRGLKPNTEYQIRLISNLGLDLRTSQKTGPGAVGNLRPTQVLDNAITLEWDAPREGAVTSYQVYISPREDTEPVTVSGTSYHFSSLSAKTEYYFQVVSIHDGMKSQPKSLMVTAGVTKAEAPTPVNILAVVLGVVLGLCVIALSIAIIMLYLKYRKLMNGNENTRNTEGGTSFNLKSVKTKKSVKNQHTASGSKVPEAAKEADFYETPATDVTPKRFISSLGPAYQNEMIGQALKPKPKPKNRRAKETEKFVYAVAN